ncbi:MAG: hypothetical protein ACTSQY_09505 [Candidatus Odinarchaeia archaeon]
MKKATFQDENFEDILNETSSLIQGESIEFKRQWPSIRYEVEDLMQEGVLVLFRCFKLYKERKELFHGYLRNSLRNHFINITKKEGITKEGKRIEKNESYNKRRIPALFGTISPDGSRLKNENRKTAINHPIFLNGLSKKAKLFINVALEIPDGLIDWMSNSPRMAYHNCVGHYLNMNRKEIKEIKAELERKLLGY